MENGGDPARFQRLVAQARTRSVEKAWPEAAALWEQVVAANPVHGAFWVALATARYENHDYAQARDAFQKVLRLGEGFPGEAAYRIACCCALLGEREQALRWLSDASDRGYRDLARARTDPDLQLLHDDARFRETLGLVDAGAISREEGWRSDLAFVAGEVKRRGYALFTRARGYAPFQSAPEEQFDAAVAGLHDAIPRLTDAAIVVALLKLMRLLGDGHSGIHALRERADLSRTLPLQFYLFEEGLHITATAPAYEKLLGTRVLGFDDASADDVIAALDPLIPRDNDQWVREMAPYRMRQPQILHALGLIASDESVRLTLEGRDGQQRSATVSATPSDPDIRDMLPFPQDWRFFPETLEAPVPLYLKNAGAPYWFEYLRGERLVYFQFNQVRDDLHEGLAAFSARLFSFIAEQAVERLVIDLRWNHGGNTFLELPLLHALTQSRVNRRGRLFVIIGRRTFSAAQNCATFIQLHTDAIFVGEPSGSSPNSVGETVPFELPYSKLRANVADLFWQTSWPMDYRTWIGPEIYTPPTFAAYSQNRDPALDAIVALREHLPGW